MPGLTGARAGQGVQVDSDEFKAGVRYFYVHVGGSSSLFTGLIKPGIVEPIESYMILKEVKDPKNCWGGHIYVDKGKRFGYAFNAYRSKDLWYNTNLVDPKELRSFDDLLDPKWKGKIGVYDPRRPGAGSSTWSFMWDMFLDFTNSKLQVRRLNRLQCNNHTAFSVF